MPESVMRRFTSGEFRPVDAATSSVRYRSSHEAMGTVFSVIAYGQCFISLEKAVQKAFREVDRLNSIMSHYKPESELCAISRGAWRQEVVVTAELFKLLEESLRYSEETTGAFDVTIGPLMKSWGFFRGWGRLPSSTELAQALQRIGYRHIRLNTAARTIRFDQPGIELDLGAIGKGYAVDRAVEVLRGEGITQALVSSGTSSIHALGSPPGEQGWKISVCHPLDRRKKVCSLRLQNLSISVSGDYEQFFQLDGKIYTHIIDPRTGMPAEGILMTAVISPSASESDALSTSFFVAGIESSRAYLDRHPNLTALLYTAVPFQRTVEQVMLKSGAMKLPVNSFAIM